MTDVDLARELNIPVEVVPKIQPKTRAAYERMIELSRRRRWKAGLPVEPSLDDWER